MFDGFIDHNLEQQMIVKILRSDLMKLIKNDHIEKSSLALLAIVYKRGNTDIEQEHITGTNQF